MPLLSVYSFPSILTIPFGNLGAYPIVTLHDTSDRRCTRPHERIVDDRTLRSVYVEQLAAQHRGIGRLVYRAGLVIVRSFDEVEDVCVSVLTGLALARDFLVSAEGSELRPTAEHEDMLTDTGQFVGRT